MCGVGDTYLSGDRVLGVQVFGLHHVLEHVHHLHKDRFT
jgi:hypothetical protein